MKTKKIEIEIPEGKRAEWVNGVLTLADESQKDNRSVTERIKTFEDARRELGSAHPLVEEYETITCRCSGLSTDILAYMKLRIICAALNEGWGPQYTKNEWRYYPRFIIYAQEEVDDTDEEKRSRVVYCDCDYAYVYDGVSSEYVSHDASSTTAYIGLRLAFKSSELAEYAGKQFSELYAGIIFRG